MPSVVSMDDREDLNRKILVFHATYICDRAKCKQRDSQRHLLANTGTYIAVL